MIFANKILNKVTSKERKVFRVPNVLNKRNIFNQTSNRFNTSSLYSNTRSFSRSASKLEERFPHTKMVFKQNYLGAILFAAGVGIVSFTAAAFFSEEKSRSGRFRSTRKEAENVLLGIIAANGLVYTAFQIRYLAPRMTQLFIHFPFTGKSFTLLTCVFAHTSLVHLIFNCIALHSFGVVGVMKLGYSKFSVTNFF